MSNEIGKVTRMPVREVWPNERNNFTTWLVDNIDSLDDVLGLGLSSPTREDPAGDLLVDIVADSNQGTIVIENQFGRSDHKHLGQLITYLAEKDTQRAIWIAESPKNEHKHAVQVLNERGIGEVWFVKVDAIRIDDSLPAALFTVVVEPNIDNEQSVTTTYKKNYDAQTFWEALFANAESMNIQIPHRGNSARPTPQLDTPAIGPHVMYRLAVNQKNARILCTNRKDERLDIYDYLYKHKCEIDTEFTKDNELTDLSWQDSRESGRWWISFEVGVGYASEKSSWENYMPKLNNASARIKDTLDPYLKKAPTQDKADSVDDSG